MNREPEQVTLGWPRGKFVRLDQESADGEWRTVAIYAAIDALAVDVGVNQMLSCGCGSYPYGMCELCDKEQDA